MKKICIENINSDRDYKNINFFTYFSSYLSGLKFVVMLSFKKYSLKYGTQLFTTFHCSKMGLNWFSVDVQNYLAVSIVFDIAAVKGMPKNTAGNKNKEAFYSFTI